MKTFTTGEIFRLGLLKNHKGEPYSNKGTLSKIVNGLNPQTIKTPWGIGKVLTQKQIDDYNQSRLHRS